MKPNPRHPLARPLQTLLAAVALVLALTGCDVATSRQPVGRTPAKLDDLKLEGVWRTGDGRPFFVRVVDPALAHLEIASVATNAQGFFLEHTEVFLRAENDVLLASFRAREPKPEEDFVFGRLAVTEDALVLTLPPTKEIKRLAVDGTVGANISGGSPDGQGEHLQVVVTNGFERLGTILASPTGGQYLDASHPVVLTRQKAGLD